ncbi:MAG: M48 family metallopeptidase [Bacteroidota bacterium]|jgi:predicted Zn-dependent protease
MNKKVGLPLLLLVVLMFSCTKVPVSGRRQMHLLPESMLINMGASSYRQILQQTPPSSASNVNSMMVKNMGQKMSQAVAKYLKSKKQSSRIEGFKWEFNLVNSKDVNAFCLPGGKVIINEGILAVTQTEAALAVVMGHEIAHAIARHGNERMSQGLLVATGGLALQIALSQNPSETNNLFLQSYGLGTQMGILKYSRTHESEADKIGLIFCAMAGYNPQEAIGFWERMSKIGGAKPPQILSTHPSDDTRIKDLKAFMPKALKYYKPS